MQFTQAQEWIIRKARVTGRCDVANPMIRGAAVELERAGYGYTIGTCFTLTDTGHQVWISPSK